MLRPTASYVLAMSIFVLLAADRGLSSSRVPAHGDGKGLIVGVVDLRSFGIGDEETARVTFEGLDDPLASCYHFSPVATGMVAKDGLFIIGGIEPCGYYTLTMLEVTNQRGTTTRQFVPVQSDTFAYNGVLAVDRLLLLGRVVHQQGGFIHTLASDAQRRVGALLQERRGGRQWLSDDALARVPSTATVALGMHEAADETDIAAREEAGHLQDAINTGEQLQDREYYQNLPIEPSRRPNDGIEMPADDIGPLRLLAECRCYQQDTELEVDVYRLSDELGQRCQLAVDRGRLQEQGVSVLNLGWLRFEYQGVALVTEMVMSHGLEGNLVVYDVVANCQVLPE